MNNEEKNIIEDIIREGAKSFSGDESTKHWTNDTIWFDAAPIATKGIEKAKNIYDEANRLFRKKKWTMENYSRAYFNGRWLEWKN